MEALILEKELIGESTWENLHPHGDCADFRRQVSIFLDFRLDASNHFSYR